MEIGLIPSEQGMAKRTGELREGAVDRPRTLKRGSMKMEN
jgi:hypothetical protein